MLPEVRKSTTFVKGFFQQFNLPKFSPQPRAMEPQGCLWLHSSRALLSWSQGRVGGSIGHEAPEALLAYPYGSTIKCHRQMYGVKCSQTKVHREGSWSQGRVRGFIGHEATMALVAYPYGSTIKCPRQCQTKLSTSHTHTKVRKHDKTIQGWYPFLFGVTCWGNYVSILANDITMFPLCFRTGAAHVAGRKWRSKADILSDYKRKLDENCTCHASPLGAVAQGLCICTSIQRRTCITSIK